MASRPNFFLMTGMVMALSITLVSLCSIKPTARHGTAQHGMASQITGWKADTYSSAGGGIAIWMVLKIITHATGRQRKHGVLPGPTLMPVP